MALEGLTTEQIDEYEKDLLGHVPDSDNIGNVTLSNALGGGEDALYWDIRNRLIERGVLVQGRGRGGSVRRLLAEPAVAAETVPVEVISAATAAEEAATRESDLYQPMADVLRNRWAKEHRLDSLLVEVTAAQGSRQTKGKWTRPDITVASYTTFPYVPGRHFDVIMRWR